MPQRGDPADRKNSSNQDSAKWIPPTGIPQTERTLQQNQDSDNGFPQKWYPQTERAYINVHMNMQCMFVDRYIHVVYVVRLCQHLEVYRIIHLLHVCIHRPLCYVYIYTHMQNTGSSGGMTCMYVCIWYKYRERERDREIVCFLTL